MHPTTVVRSVMGSLEFRNLWGFGLDPCPNLIVMTDAPGLRYWFHLRDKLIGQEIAHNTYELKVTALVRRLIKPGMAVLDIGANLGYYSVLMGAHGCTVHAFEPFPGNFALLTRNIAENRLTTVTAHQIAAHSETKTGKLFFRDDDQNENYGSMFTSGNSQPRHLSSVDVCYAQLDGYLSSAGGFGFAKIDAEGAEIHVLRGMSGILKRDRPILVLELNEEALLTASGHTPEQLLAALGELGYRVFDVETGEPYTLPATRQTYVVADLLCRPEENH